MANLSLVLGNDITSSVAIDELKKVLGSYDETRVKFLVAQDHEDETSEGVKIIEELSKIAPKHIEFSAYNDRLLISFNARALNELHNKEIEKRYQNTHFLLRPEDVICPIVYNKRKNRLNGWKNEFIRIRKKVFFKIEFFLSVFLLNGTESNAPPRQITKPRINWSGVYS